MSIGSWQTDDASEEEMAYKDFTLSVKKDGTSGDTIDPLKTSVRLWMADDYKIKRLSQIQ